MSNYRLVIFFLLLLLSPGILAAPVQSQYEDSTDTIYLASLEWPPFTSKQLANNGKTAELVSHIFKNMGYRVVIDFLPWSRAVKLSSGRNPKYLAYFPEYPLQHDDFKLSGCIGYSHVGLAEHKESPLHINSTIDLQNYRLGVVQDYVNTTTIDQMIKDKRLNIEVSLTDKQNLLRLSHQRLDAAVIDYDVMQYLIASDPELKAIAHVLHFNSSEYELKTLHMAVNIHHPAASLLKEFNQELSAQSLPSNFITTTTAHAGLCQPWLNR
jgi:polar amino acid transport system substrate-binding protein